MLLLGGGDDVEVRLEPVAEPVPDPFTDSVAVDEKPLTAGLRAPAVAEDALPPRDGPHVEDTDGLPAARAVAVSLPGLYGGTRDRGSCDAAQLVAFLDGNPEAAAAWAGVFEIAPARIGDFVDTLTPVVLTRDTRVTNHGFAGGEATRMPSVLQAGTAVLVDDRGVPRVKCDCGNPLLPPASIPSGATVGFRGEPRSGWNPGQLVVVDVDGGDPFSRPVGTAGADDADFSDGELCDLFPDDPVCDRPAEEPEPEAEPEAEPDPGASTDHPDADWNSTAQDYRGQDGLQVSYDCPAGGEAWTVWGSDVYTDDSLVRTAAVHAGLITFASGGTVVIEIRPGQASYDASTRNGVESLDWPDWPGSFVFSGEVTDRGPEPEPTAGDPIEV